MPDSRAAARADVSGRASKWGSDIWTMRNPSKGTGSCAYTRSSSIRRMSAALRRPRPCRPAMRRPTSTVHSMALKDRQRPCRVVPTGDRRMPALSRSRRQGAHDSRPSPGGDRGGVDLGGIFTVAGVSVKVAATISPHQRTASILTRQKKSTSHEGEALIHPVRLPLGIRSTKTPGKRRRNREASTAPDCGGWLGQRYPSLPSQGLKQLPCHSGKLNVSIPLIKSHRTGDDI